MWKKIIIGASGEMRDANTQFVGNPALPEMPVEYVTNLIKAHCIHAPQNLHTPLKFPNPPKLSQNIHNPAFFIQTQFEHYAIEGVKCGQED